MAGLAFGSPMAPKTYTPASYATATAAGGQRSSPQSDILGGKFQQYSDALKGSVQGYGNLVGQQFQNAVGSMLGDMNSIGGLRSGAVPAETNRMMQTFGSQVGNYAMMASQDALRMASEDYNKQAERDFDARKYKDAKNASTAGGVGKILGAIGGSAFGPVGGAVGGALGGLLGGLF